MSNAATAEAQKFEFQLDEFYLDLQEGGQNIVFLSQAEIARMPFPGLRPFKTSEFQIFKGRDGQAAELIRRLKQNRFLAVIGSSGTGKSSLVRAGLIPELYAGGLREAGNDWKIAICRPGKNPVANLAVAIASIKGKSKDEGVLYEHYKTTEPVLSRSIFGLLDINESLAKEDSGKTKSSLLVIVDQFEELFRYDRKDLNKENIENHFVDLLLQAAASPYSSVYVVITMRSEFLGDCVKFRGLPEEVNKGQYLVPALNRDELAEVIEGPVCRAGKTIDNGLVELLINEIEGGKLKENLDQLPVLQHALMRTYQLAAEKGDEKIEYGHYRDVGGLNQALALHAREKFNALKDGSPEGQLSKRQQIAKLIFQALTDASTDLRGGRRPTELKNIHAIAAALGAKAEVNGVINSFRGSETSFIMPPINTVLHDNLMIDIAHESLMRRWDDLKQWVKEETQNGKWYQQLNERRRQGQPIAGAFLADLLRWRSQYQHNSAWASRYHGAEAASDDVSAHQGLYDANLAFLKQSEKAVIEEEETKKKEIAEKARKEEEVRQREQKIVEAAQRNQEEALRMQQIEFAGQRQKELELRDQQSKFESQIKKREQKEREKKWLLYAIAAVLLGVSIAAGFAFIEKDKAKANLFLAQQQKNSATAAKVRAEQLLRQLHVKEILADSLKEDAYVRRDTAQARENRIKQLLERMERLNNERQEALAEIEKRAAKDYLNQQPFYNATFLKFIEKEAISRELLIKPLKDLGYINYSKYIRLALQNKINKAVEAREMFIESPVFGLKFAKEAWDNRDSKQWVEKILSGIFTQTLFPKQQVDPILYQSSLSDRPYLLAAAKNSRFVLADSDQIVIGSLSGNSLRLNNVLWTKPIYYNDLLKDTLSRQPDSLLFEDYGPRKVNAVAVKSDNELVFLENDSLVVMQRGGEAALKGELYGNSRPRLAQFSPDGKYLTVVKDNALLRWNVDTMKGGHSYLPDTLKRYLPDTTISSLLFSPDGQTLAVSLSNRKFDFWDLDANKPSAKFGNDVEGEAATFSPGSNYFLAAKPEFSTRYVDVYDTAGRRVGFFTPFASPRDRNVKSDSVAIRQVTIAPDCKSLLINFGDTLLLFTGESGDSILKSDGRTNRLSLSDKLHSLNQATILDAHYLDANNIVSLTEDGRLYRWQITDRFSSLQKAFDDVQNLVDFDDEETGQIDSSAFERLTEDTNRERLRNVASYYFRGASGGDEFWSDLPFKTILKRTKQLFLKLASEDTGFWKQIDSVKLSSLNKLEVGQAAADSLRAMQGKLDTLARIKRLQGYVRESESALKKFPSDSSLKKSAASDYWNLSWYSLFVNACDSAIIAAKRGFELDPVKDGINTNLALAYLLKGEFDSAETVYKKYNGKEYSDDTGRKFTEVFLQDFEVLVKYGIISKAKPDVYNKMEEIKTKILGVK